MCRKEGPAPKTTLWLLCTAEVGNHLETSRGLPCKLQQQPATKQINLTWLLVVHCIPLYDQFLASNGSYVFFPLSPVIAGGGFDWCHSLVLSFKTPPISTLKRYLLCSSKKREKKKIVTLRPTGNQSLAQTWFSCSQGRTSATARFAVQTSLFIFRGWKFMGGRGQNGKQNILEKKHNLQVLPSCLAWRGKKLLKEKGFALLQLSGLRKV